MSEQSGNAGGLRDIARVMRDAIKYHWRTYLASGELSDIPVAPGVMEDWATRLESLAEQPAPDGDVLQAAREVLLYDWEMVISEQDNGDPLTAIGALQDAVDRIESLADQPAPSGDAREIAERMRKSAGKSVMVWRRLVEQWADEVESLADSVGSVVG